MKTYAKLLLLDANTLNMAYNDVHNGVGNHIRPVWVNPRDKYLLFEVTCNEDHTETISNVWSSSDLLYITDRMKRFSSYYDYMNGTYKSFEGNELKLTTPYHS